ncbi:MAG: metallopeptidase TldD-related protein [Desulfitobacteriaceae bacterium]
MKLVAQLEELLRKFQTASDAGEYRLSGWRIFVHESQSLALGLKDNSPGSVYTPPAYREGESGEVFVVWADGKCSQAKVQAKPTGELQSWQNDLQDWRQAAYEDPDGTTIVIPAPLPLVAVEDRAIAGILAGDDEVLFGQLARLLAEKPMQAKMQAHINAIWGYRHVRTSTGLAVSYRESQYILSYSLDRLVGTGFAKRRLIKAEEWTDRWDTVLGYYEALQKGVQPGASPVSQETTVILTPSVVEEMLGQYIVPNFSGQSVLEGQSAFRPESFHKREKIFGPEFSLIVDPLRPWEWGSYLVTLEGVPAERTTLVRNGALETPFLRVKDAKRWGGKPTAIPQGTAGLFLSHRQEANWASVLKGVEDGVLILSVLGLHTQDSVSGDYSLSAPQCIRILNGHLVGSTGVKITGNFFKDLAAPSTRVAREEREVQPYLLIKTGVQSL